MCEDTIKYQIENTEGQNPWAVISGGDTLISNTVARDYMLYNYGNFLCFQLYNKFTLYNLMQAADLKKALTAWNAEYNPIDNYNKTEITTDITNHGAETKTRETGGESGTHNTITTAAQTGTGTQTYTTTYDSTTPRLETEEKQTGGNIQTDDLYTKNTTTHGTTTMTIDSTTYTGDEIYHHENTTSGNIGVTTNQQMIMSECDMRLNPVIKQYLDRFIYQYAFYVGGAWC